MDKNVYQIISTRAKGSLRFFKLCICDRTFSSNVYQNLRELRSKGVKVFITSSESQKYFCNCTSDSCMELQKDQERSYDSGLDAKGSQLDE
jgi:hypothetical protein